MKDEQANNKLLEKTIQQQAEEIETFKDAMVERNDAYNKANELLESLRKDFHVLFSELSEKDTLIETTHNNLIAALEENKRLRDMMEDMYKSWHNLYYSGDLSKNQLDEQADKRWKNFAKEYKVEP